MEGRVALHLARDFRRLVVRYEYKVENFLGLVHLGRIVILLRTCV